VKAFKNVTNQGNEPAVKKAVNLPDDSINLGWFNSGEITPEMHLSVSDLSGLIPENLVPVSTSEIDTAMYADEFGVLRYVKTNQEMNQQFGSPIVANSEVSISNYILNKQQTDLNFNYTGRIVDLESEMFIHSYYVSNHFALLDSSVSSYNGIEKSSELREPAKAGIQVVDSSGNNLVDSNGKNNYTIILEKYTNHRSIVELSGTIYQGLDLYRIIVLLEQVNPQDLYLIYNKYEKNEDNIPYNPFFGYKEKINTIQYYKPVAEESEVIDPSSSERKVYSTQLFSYKENELLKNKISNDGWKVYAPRKAIQDPRTFQPFNWRLLAKIKYNYANVRNVYAESERATLKVGVLYSGQVSQVKNPYVFANMEESVFNLQNYLFENPIAASTNNKSQKNYWLVNIDDNTIDYSKFDILVWTPIQDVTELQGSAINRALSSNASVFIDASLISAGFSYLGIDLSIDGAYTSTGLLTVQETYKNGNTTMNAWDLTEYHESSTTPKNSIFGKRKDGLNNDAIVSLRTFNGAPSTQSSSVALVSVNSKAVIVKRSTVTGNILPSSLVISANPFLYLTNDIVKADGSSVSNNGDTNAFPVGTVGNQTSAVSTLIIGPNKFFYNYLSDVNKNKVNNFATNNTTNQSTILWNVSPWRNFWTINGAVKNGQVTVLSELEKQEYNFSFKNAIDSDEQKFCRQIYPSISAVLLGDFEGTLNGQDAESIINADFSNVEFYLECTNPNVKFLNFTDYNSTLSAGGDTLLGQPNSSYKIFKLDTKAFNQITANPPSAVSLNAYSTVNSNQFDFSSISYPYAILGASEYNSRTDSVIKTPTDFLPGSQDVRDYNFAFKTSISINEITKTVNSYKINWSTSFSSDIGGSADFKNVVFKPKGGTAGISKSNFSISEVEENKVQIKQTFSPFNKYYYPGKAFSKTDIVSADQTETESSFNNFHYTGDIDAGNRWDEYFAGKDSFSTTGTTTSTASSVPISTNVTTTTTKGPVLNNEIIRAAIRAARESDGSYETGTISYLTSGASVPIGFWSTLVWKSGDAITLSIFFHQWLDKFTKGLGLTGSAIDQFLLSATGIFISNEFIQQNPIIYTAIEKQTLGGVSPGKVFTSTTTTSTVSRPTTRNGYSADFVKYVQYTLLKMGHKITVDGLYGYSTGTQIRLFQHNAGLGFVDGIVDSQTKSVLATYWLNLYKNNNEKYNDLRAGAPTGSQKYISAAVRYSDISNIGIAGKEYRRISFTGVPGPTVLEDYILFKVPQKANDQVLHSVTVSTGEFGVVLGGIDIFTSDLDIQKFYQRKKEKINIPGRPEISARSSAFFLGRL
jgi:peptidoglycan hydrolase-like protein with peptidoglycan-binding domain